MHKVTLYLIFHLLLIFSTFASYAQEIVISGLPHEITNYKKWLGNKKCTDINSYQNDYATKASTQIMLICKALQLGGFNATLSFNSMPNYSRSLFEAYKGRIAIPGDSIWLSQISQKHFYTAPPIFAEGEFQKGFFALPDKRKEIEEHININKSKGITSLQTLRDYIVITSQNWIFDQAAIKNLELTHLYTTKTENMCNMIKYGRGDLYFGELIMIGNKKIVFNCNGLILEPIKGIKVAFTESRHFVVSKNIANSSKIYEALRKGLNILRASGEIEKAFYPHINNKNIIVNWLDLLSLSPEQKQKKNN
ncbi:hypothetical protein Q4506_08025 [Colwellia sp. 4_MG-2023]|uniref:hypothetical protein n=1 Tax=unclassified Colwellia TaxID=196834 RepID=UPI0026E21F17|nr:MULTISPECIES: hypothetical protein [unclassified Colwellia]MDO6507630.1 hypothetical protein [Colwellia sp. 5_MG-2023]MDO6555626.1 hypothetical protein [Colwellia sp. 4_MG-2023]